MSRRSATILSLPLLWLFGPAATWLLLVLAGLGWTAGHTSSWGAIDRSASAAVGSQQCRRCHPAQYESWHRTYHRTMTQAVMPASALAGRSDPVLAPFAGETLDTLGFRATMDRDEQGWPRVRVHRVLGGDMQGEPILDARVELTIGSHRYQQYVARIDRGGGTDERWRLPVAWHLGEQRWIHLSGAFLLPDGAPGNEDDYLTHLSRWNDNCLFCHNTQPVPGLGADGTFDTHVFELGIACEACHGPASDHLRRHANPRRTVHAARGSSPDGSVAHPGRMNAARSAQVCGRCHGNRIGHDLAQILAEGDGFVPGTDLADVSRPIFADSSLASDPEQRPFALRFWPDQTPRLSAYEYQALLLSPCHDDGRGMTCGDCHSMHDSDPDMQLRADFSPESTCGRCHPTRELSSGGVHGGHRSVDCLGCHMPRITYGLLEGMISHRVTSPDPGRWVGRNDQPDACTQCHVEQSRSWAAAAMSRLGLAGTAPEQPDPSEAWGSRVELDLWGGDPIQRALAAHALARPDAVGDRSRAKSALVDALEDEYPAVRWFAWRALRALADGEPAAIVRELERFDVRGDPAIRLQAVDRLRAHFGPSALQGHPRRLERLQQQRDDRLIEIGE